MRGRIDENPATRRRGAVVVLVAASLATLLVFASFAVDVGYICALTSEAQDNADAGSLAGASALHQGKYDSYQDRTLDLLSQNQKYQGYDSLGDQIVEVGRWDRYTRSFTTLDPTLARKANAVRVRAVRADADLFFASIIGHTSTDVSREAIAMVSPTCGGVWGIDEVFVPGNVLVDSYDSTEGTYSTGSAYENGDVCSTGPLRVAGSIEIHGDTLGAPVEVSGGKATITGYIDDLSSPVELPPIEFGDVATTNDNNTIGLTDLGNDPFPSAPLELYIKANDNLTLQSGTYYFNSVGFEAAKGTKVEGSITVTGPTTIYVAGDIGLNAQGTFNTTTNPHDLTIYVAGDYVNITGGAAFYGSIYAPDAKALLAGNADMYGALIANEVQMTGNFGFHVDESLPIVHTLKSPPMLVK